MNLQIKKGIISGCFIFMVTALMAQDKYFTKSGSINFVSKGAIETIQANHRSVTCVLDSKTGALQFAVLMKGFEFKKALMQEHFNENYMESDKLPRADYKGSVADIASVNFDKDGTYKVSTKGKLTIHGVARDVTVPATITVKGGKAEVSAKFIVKPKDYNIAIPSIVEDKIAKEVEVNVNSILEKK